MLFIVEYFAHHLKLLLCKLLGRSHNSIICELFSIVYKVVFKKNGF